MLAPVGDRVHAEGGEGVVEVHLEAGGLPSQLGDGGGVVDRGPHHQGIVAVRLPFSQLLGKELELVGRCQCLGSGAFKIM